MNSSIPPLNTIFPPLPGLPPVHPECRVFNYWLLVRAANTSLHGTTTEDLCRAIEKVLPRAGTLGEVVAREN